VDQGIKYVKIIQEPVNQGLRLKRLVEESKQKLCAHGLKCISDIRQEKHKRDGENERYNTPQKRKENTDEVKPKT
jgi:hypothetical protein